MTSMAAPTKSKEERRRAILRLVRRRSLHTQQELSQELAQLGIHATQATVSRDIQELGLVRTSDGYRTAVPVSAAGELVLSATQVEFLAVIRTPPGTASLVARTIDESALDEIAGTLAGDDTIIVVLTRADAYPRLCSFLGV